jgi:hypothetical protein
MKNKGYDPAWAAHHLGIVLHLEILRDLERHDVPVSYIDYSAHFNAFKLRTTNEHRPAQSYYLFPRTIAGAIQYVTVKSAHLLSRSMASVLDRLHLREASPPCTTTADH